MGPDGAVNIVYGKEIDEAEDKVAAKGKFVEEYRAKFANPFKAAELGFIDGVIYPRNTRQRITNALEMLKDKRDQNPPKKHGNIPL
jgi:propionyl-CoA carboxylase beta chain